MPNWCWLIKACQIKTTVSVKTHQLSFVSLASGGNSGEAELLCLSSGSPVDLLCGPVPSCLPSPQLHPDPVLLLHRDLIRFEEHSRSKLNGGTREDQPVHDRQPQAVLKPTEHCTATNDVSQTVETSASSLGETPTNNVEKNTECQSGNTKSNDPPDPVVTKPSQSPNPKPSVTESPSKRTFRNKIKLAANFSFSPTPTV